VLVRFRLDPAIRGIGGISVAATILLFAAALVVLWRRPALISRALGAVPRLRRHAGRVRALESQIYTFASRHKRSLPALAGAEAAFHALGVAEVYLTLRLLDVPVSPTTAFLFESANRLMTVIFKFVPLRLGVDEAGTAAFATIIGLSAKTGLSLGIIRKVRVVFWAAAGGLLLVREGLSARRSQLPRDRIERR
jgi:hypothetical protein